jgi:WD40 repeat protein
MRRLILFSLIIYTPLWLILRPIPHTAKHDLYIVFPRAKFDRYGTYLPYDIGVLHVNSGIQHTIKVGSIDGEKIFVSKLGEIIFATDEGVYRTDYQGTKPEKLSMFQSIYNIFSWSPDGKYLITSDENHWLFYLYDWQTLKIITFFENLYAVSWSSDSHYLAFTLENEREKHNIVYIMDMQRLSASQALTLGTSVDLGAWSPNNQYIVIRILKHTVYLYSVLEDTLKYLNSENGVRWLGNNSVIYWRSIAGGFSYFIQQIHEPFSKSTRQLQVTGLLLRVSPDNRYVSVLREDSSFGVAGTLCYENIHSQSIKCFSERLYRYASVNWIQN